MTDIGYVFGGQYYVGINVTEVVTWYKGEDSKAYYADECRDETVEFYNLSPVLDTVMPTGQTIKAYIDDIANKNCKYTCSFLEYAKSIPGVIVSRYSKNFGIIGYLPEIYDEILFLYNAFYAVKKGNFYAFYKVGDNIKDEDFKYQNIRDLGHSQVEVTYEGKKTFVTLVNNKVENLFDYNFESIKTLNIDEETFSMLWPNLCIDNTFIVCLKGKYGVFNTICGWIISCKYDSIQFLEGNKYIASCLSSKYGLIDGDENVIYPFKFDHIKTLDFEIQGLWDSCTNDDTFYYLENGLYGVFNINKGVILGANYNSIELYVNNSLKVTINKKVGVIEPSGNIIIPCNFDDIKPSADNRSKVTINKKCGIVDHSGNVVIPCNFDHVFLEDGYYYICEYLSVYFGPHRIALKGVMSYNGKLLFPCEYWTIKKYDHFFVVSKEGLYGCVNFDGERIIDCKYSSLEAVDCYFIASVNYYNGIELYGVIDCNDNILVPFIYTKIDYLEAGSFDLYIRRKSVKFTIGAEITYFDIKSLCKNLYKRKLIAWGIVDDKGNEISPCIYSDIKYDENYDIFRVSIGRETYKLWGILDGKGNVLCPAMFGVISTFKDGKAKVCAYHGKGEISVDGKLIPSNVVKLDSIYSAAYSIGRWAFIRKDGTLASNYVYKSINCIADGFYVVEFEYLSHRYLCDKTCFGLLNKELETVIPIWYDSISKLTEKLFLVKRFQHYGCMNYTGQIVFSVDYDDISVLEDGNVRLKKSWEISIYDQEGNCLIDNVAH